MSLFYTAAARILALSVPVFALIALAACSGGVGGLGLGGIANTGGATGNISVTTASLPAGTEGASYNAVIAASGGLGGVYNWTLLSGPVPAGLTFYDNPSDMVALAGTPNANGTFSLTVKVSDLFGNSAQKTLSLTIVPVGSPLAVATPAALPDGMLSQAYNVALSASGGSGAGYTWSLAAASAFPAGLALSRGALTGVPTVSGGFNFTVEVRDSAGNTATQAFSLVIGPTGSSLAVSNGSALASGAAGQAYAATLSASGGSGAGYTWSLAAGSALPAGLSLGQNGTVSGTPTSSGTFTFTVEVRDSAGASALKALTLTLAAAGTVPPPVAPTRDFFDFNGDGIGDMMLGAAHVKTWDTIVERSSGNYTGNWPEHTLGRVYIFLGPIVSANLDVTQADVVITGERLGDRFGLVSAPIGDFNNDGYDDIVVGTMYANAQFGPAGTVTVPPTGKAYIFLGSANPAPQRTALDAEYSLVGIPSGTNVNVGGGRFGCSVSGAGDFNNDGYDDVLVGARMAPLHSSAAMAHKGEAYIFFGRSANPGAIYAPIEATSADVTFTGEAIFDYFGVSLCGMGDFNGDGIDDVAVGAFQGRKYSAFGGHVNPSAAPGKAYIFFGSASPATAVSASAADAIFTGTAIGDEFGYAISGADYNGDGKAELIVGAPFAWDAAGNKQTGAAYIFFGTNTPASSAIPAAGANVTIFGDGSYDGFGVSVGTAGYFNGDDYEDIVIGAWDAYNVNSGPVGNVTGMAYVFHGTGLPQASMTTGNANVVLGGEAYGDRFGSSVASFGDLDNDGRDDLIVGAQYAGNNGPYSGSVYLFKGASVPPSALAASAANTRVYGELPGDQLGPSFLSSVSGSLENW